VKKQIWVEGAYIKIPLGNSCYSLARLLKSPNVAFYDDVYKENDEVSFGQRKIAFITCIYTDIIKKGEWIILMEQTLEPELRVAPKYFKQDPITKDYFIYQDGIEIPCDKEDCNNLERLAVWDSRHIVDRLNDLRTGQPNKWVESLKL